MVGVTAVWGSTFVLVRDAVEQIPPFTFIAYRFLAAAVLLAALRPRLPAGGQPGLVGGGAVAGLALFAGYGFQTVGLQYTTASNAGFITGLSKSTSCYTSLQDSTSGGGMKRGAIYARISSDREGTGQKVDDQIRDCLALAERLDLDVTKERIYRDDSISAYQGKRRRDGYLALLAAIRGGQVDAVLATDADRIHRGVRELLDYLDACAPRDIPTYTVRAGNMDLSTSTGRMTAKLAAVIAEGEVEKAIERMRAARLHKVERGEWTGNKRPYAYEADGVTVRDDEADALRWATGQILAGNSLSAVAKEL